MILVLNLFPRRSINQSAGEACPQSMRCDLQKQTSENRCRRAFSIVELVIAMALIGMLVLAVYGAITSGMGTIRMTRENLRATQILLEKMEGIRLYNWGQLAPGFVPVQFITNYDVNNSATNSGVLYYGTVTIAPA